MEGAFVEKGGDVFPACSARRVEATGAACPSTANTVDSDHVNILSYVSNTKRGAGQGES